ncbi:MAG: TspO/MBR family protein [Patescibacteria group bacterium]
MKINYIIIPLLTLVTAVLGSIFTSQGMIWYKTLDLPNFTPSGSVIGLVWTVIFTLAAISALLVWNQKTNNRHWLILVFFLFNAALNILWSYLFFEKHLINLAIWEAWLLEVSVLVLVFLTWPISKVASALLWPYAIWVMFATYLTYSVWLLNR